MESTGAPFYYDYVNSYNGSMSPSTVHCKNSALVQFFSRNLLQRAMSPWKFTFPENWSENYVKYVLFSWGYFTVFKTRRYGIVAQACGLCGYDLYYQPTHAVVSNPVFERTLNLKIGQICEIVKLRPDYSGVMSIVSYYADMLGILAEASGFNMINSKLAYLFIASNKAMAETYKKMYDEISSGNPAVVIDKNMRDEQGELNIEYFSQDLGKNYINQKLLQDMQTLLEMFDREVGMPSTNTQKKERLLTSEVGVNVAQTTANIHTWVDSVYKSVDKVNNLFGEEILKIEWKGTDLFGNNVDTGCL